MSNIEEVLKINFSKKFEFSPPNDWVLPHPDVLNRDETWDIENLLQLKTKLNDIKSQLNDKGELWQKHTASINIAALVRDSIKKLIEPEFLTQAWCKFYEILATYPLIPYDDDETIFRSFHLCEAPGCFISALNYFLHLGGMKRKWHWYANTLNPYYEGAATVKHVVVDDRLIFHTLRNWHFGRYDTGDIICLDYLNDVIDFFNTKGPVHLVTADGSINCMNNPGEQELIVANLLFSEVLIALHILAPGGSFVVKKFTFFECTSVCVMYLLNCVFEKVVVFKPITSKAGNSEVYIVCLNFKGVHVLEPYYGLLKEHSNTTGVSLFPKNDIPLSFVMQLEVCCRKFAYYQSESIKENLKLFTSMTPEMNSVLNELQSSCVTKYIEKYSLQPLHPTQYHRLFPLKKMKSHKSPFGNDGHDLKFQFYKSIGSTFDNIQLQKTLTWEEKLLNFEHRLDLCFSKTKNNIEPVSWIPVWKELLSFLKGKEFNKWISCGKRIGVVKNSKFCNPFILLVFEELTQSNELSSAYYDICSSRWDWDYSSLFSEYPGIASVKIIYCVNPSEICKSNIIDSIKSAVNENIQLYSGTADDMVMTLAETKDPKIIAIDTTVWCTKILCNEPFMKADFIHSIRRLIEILKEGDCIILCIESLLTRFMVGIHFMLLSLFSQLAILHAGNTASTFSGQIWLLANYQKREWTESILAYLASISTQLNMPCIDVLEVLPITALCRNQFYDCVLKTNNVCMLQKMYNLFASEKAKLKYD